MLLCVAADDIITGRIFIHHIEEHLLNTRTFLIDGIVKRVHQMIHALNDLLLIHQFRRRHVVACQFLAIISQLFELDALRMCQKEQINGLMHRLEFHFFLVIHQHETIILRNHQSAQFTLGGLDTQFLQQGHTYGMQQQVFPTLCLQLAHESFQLQGALLRCQQISHPLRPS